MVRIIIFLVVLLIVWQVFRAAGKGGAIKATLDEARTVGLQEASAYIQSPILLNDYAEARGISKEKLESMVKQEVIPSYKWHQYIFIENRELIDINK